MTALGATLYVGLFVLAALWLFLTAEAPVGAEKGAKGQGQRQDFSNSTSRSADSVGSIPMLVSHSSSK
ncbi:hypothetical protein BH09ACT8_BH09ACT8_44110 [soil metagenome]